MAELPEDLRACVEDQAQARVEMSVQGYAKYLTPEAVDTLRGSYQGIPPRVNGFEIAAVDPEASDYWVDVRYMQRDEPFVVRSRWSQRGGPWQVVHAERLWAEGESRPGIVSRLVARLLGPLARRRRA